VQGKESLFIAALVIAGMEGWWHLCGATVVAIPPLEPHPV